MIEHGAGPAAGGPPGGGAGVDVWRTDRWRELAVSWLDEQLAAAGIERTGEVDQPHLRPWATVLTAPTTRGPVWFKATVPGTAVEVGLYEILRETVPDRVLHPVAVDPARGWLVLPDGGPTLGDRFTGDDLVDALAAVLPQYGQLQRDVAPQADRFVALGVVDMRAPVMPTRFDQALDAVRDYAARRGTEADRATVVRLAPLRGRYVEWCDRLAAAPVPPSLDHNDLHPWNILGYGPGAGPVRFYDWGDSVVAHPFASMLMGLGFLRFAGLVGDDDGDPTLLRLRDAYLEAFGDLAPRAELVATLELACRVGKVARALTWERAVRASRDDDSTEDGSFVDAPMQTMAALLDASYFSGA
jgi:Phosphotransferase enzyme family